MSDHFLHLGSQPTFTFVCTIPCCHFAREDHLPEAMSNLCLSFVGVYSHSPLSLLLRYRLWASYVFMLLCPDMLYVTLCSFLLRPENIRPPPLPSLPGSGMIPTFLWYQVCYSALLYGLLTYCRNDFITGWRFSKSVGQWICSKVWVPQAGVATIQKLTSTAGHDDWFFFKKY